MNLEWPKRPRVTMHPIVGRRKVWSSKCGRYWVERSVDFGGGPFLALRAKGERRETFDHRRTLKAAQRACHADAKQQAKEQHGQ